jgi:hypothetical protein
VPYGSLDLALQNTPASFVHRSSLSLKGRSQPQQVNPRPEKAHMSQLHLFLCTPASLKTKHVGCRADRMHHPIDSLFHFSLNCK